MTYAPLQNLFQVRLMYDNNDLVHQMNIWATTPNWAQSPGEPFGDYQIDTRFVAGQDAEVAVNSFVTAWRPLLPTTTTVLSAELWRYSEGSLDAEFLTALDIALVGTSASAVVLASEVIMTFRTTEGRILKVTWEEGVSAPGASAPLVTSGSPTGYNALAAWVIGNNSFFKDREGGEPFNALRLYPGQNEAIFKRRYRPNS